MANKPRPCCCCTNCPQYGGANWRFRFCGLTAGSGTLNSSTTGNHLFTDLLAMGDTIWPANISGTNPKPWSLTAATAILSGKSWTYNSVLYSSISVGVNGVDDCGKTKLTDILIRCNRGGTPSVILWRANQSTLPSSPNCNAILDTDTIVTADGVALASTGKCKVQHDLGTALSCP